MADVHGAFAALAAVASRGEPLLVLGDLLNVIDYRDCSGLLADVAGRGLVAEMVALRAAGDHAAASRRWREFVGGREGEVRRRFRELIDAEYRAAGRALGHAAEAYVTFGNVDRPDVLAACLPAQARFVDGEVVEIEQLRVGFAGGGVETPLRTPGEVPEEAMAAKLAALGPVDVLCTHAAPAVPPLSTDVIAGRAKESRAILDYLLEHRPGHHYFGDVHQPQAVWWRVGATRCVNVGYFRATGRAVRHG